MFQAISYRRSSYPSRVLIKYALAAGISLSTLSLQASLSSPDALAAEAHITMSDVNDQDLWLQLQKREQLLKAEKESLDSQQRKLSNENVYWGHFHYEGNNSWNSYDGTWDPLWGFVFPGISQLVTVFDNNAPAWLRWTEGAQLVSLGVLSLGGYQLFETEIRGRSAPFPNLTDNGANGMFYGGLGAYTALALVPSTIVSIRDSVNAAAYDKNLSENQEALNRVNRALDDLAIPLAIYTLANQQDYVQALEKVNHLSSAQVSDYHLHFERLKQWKQKVFDAEYQTYLNASLDTEARL